MRLWISTCPDDFSSEFDDIEEMFRHGLTRLILDKRRRCSNKVITSDEFIPEEIQYRRASADEYERFLLSLPMEFRDSIWVRGTPDIAEQLDVRGCVCDAQSFIGHVPESWKRVNCIAHCKNLDELKKMPAWLSGVLIGPVFQPLSAIEPIKTIDMNFEIIQRFCYSNIPLILYGGVDVDTLDDFKNFSPNGVMALGGIWNYADPINAFIKLKRACESSIISQ